MGLSYPLVIFPLFAITICILVAGSGLNIAGASPFCAGATNNLTCTPNTQTSAVQYSCSSNGPDCQLPFSCPQGGPPNPSYCISGTTFWLLPAGTAIVIPQAMISSLGPSSGQTAGSALTFAGITSAGYITLITVASTVVAIASISFFGTSPSNAEGIHISWMTALLLGLWIMLSAAEGFIGGSSTDFFAQLNTIASGLGTTIYLIMTMLFCIGTVSSVSRSSGGMGV